MSTATMAATPIIMLSSVSVARPGRLLTSRRINLPNIMLPLRLPHGAGLDSSAD